MISTLTSARCRFAPFIVVALFALWVSSPLWIQGERVFMGRLSGDNLVSLWFYEYIFQSVSNDFSPHDLTPFDYPNAIATPLEFPNVIDAYLMVPLRWLFGFPHFWGCVLSAIVLFNALSLSVLAKTMGMTGFGIVLSGVLGALMRPMWSDLAFGRMNSCYIGFGIMALACCIVLIRKQPAKTSYVIVMSIGAVCFGTLAALTYPPFLVLLIPFYPALMFIVKDKITLRRLWIPALCTLVAFAYCASELLLMVNTHMRDVSCTPMSCPDSYHHLNVNRMFIRRGLDGLSTLGVSIWNLLLLPFLFFHPHKIRIGPLLVLCSIYLFLALGPCPSGDDLVYFGSFLHCWGLQLQDFSRFAALAVPFLIIASVLGLDAFGKRYQSRWMIYTGTSVMLAFAVFDRLTEIQSPKKWHRIESSVVSDFLVDQPGSIVAELPYDRRSQFISAMYAPSVKRINPLKLNKRRQLRWQFHKWLDSLGRLELNVAPPNAQQISGSQVDWVFFDPSRCSNQNSVCKIILPERLREFLGDPITIAEDVMAWDLSRFD